MHSSTLLFLQFCRLGLFLDWIISKTDCYKITVCFPLSSEKHFWIVSWKNLSEDQDWQFHLSFRLLSTFLYLPKHFVRDESQPFGQKQFFGFSRNHRNFVAFVPWSYLERLETLTVWQFHHFCLDIVLCSVEEKSFFVINQFSFLYHQFCILCIIFSLLESSSLFFFVIIS